MRSRAGRSRSSATPTSRRCTPRSRRAVRSSRITGRPRARPCRRSRAKLARVRARARRRLVRRGARRARASRRAARTGVLAGGNLALLSALAGTPFAPRLADTILVLEDVDEAVYRVDRMMRQLLLSGLLDGVRAIVFGACTNCPEASDDGARRLDDVIVEIADAARRAGRGRCCPSATSTISGRCHSALRRRSTPSAARSSVHADPNDCLTETHAMAYKTGTDLVTEAKQRIREVTPREVLEMQRRERRGDLPRRPRAERMEPRPSA